MKVSVIMPVYNAEKTVRDAVNSVLKQSYKDFELIIVNDGSKDNTEEIIHSLVQSDDRIKAFTIENSGVSCARNIALDHCTGEYVAFIDSDDIMEPDFLETMVFYMSDDSDLICCGYKVMSYDGNYLFEQKPDDGKYDLKKYYQGIRNLQQINAYNVLWNKLFRFSVIHNNNIKMDPAVKMGEDYIFIVDYMTKMKGDMICIPSALYQYTLSKNGAQATLNQDDTIEKRISRINYIEPLYQREGYPMDSIYDEQLRYIYSSLRDNDFDKNDIVSLLKLEAIDKLGQYNPDQIKMRVFLKILMSRNAFLINMFIKSFACVKRLSGKSYKWN